MKLKTNKKYLSVSVDDDKDEGSHEEVDIDIDEDEDSISEAGSSHDVLDDWDEDDTAELENAKSGGTHTEETVRFYLNRIAHIKVLSIEEEQLYAKAAQNGDEKARAKLIESNLKLVISIAKRYLNRGVPFEDLIEEGNLGMIHAIDKFEPQRNLRFSTYATWWIRQSVARAVMNQGRTVRVPVHVLRDLYHVLDVKNLLEKEQNDGKPVKPEKIAQFLNRPIGEVYAILQTGEQTISLDKKLDESNGFDSFIEFMIDEDHTPDMTLENKDDVANINYILKKLYEVSPKYYEIIVARFGVNGAELKTYDTLAQEYGVTRERVRQMMLNAIHKLKDFSKTSQIDYQRSIDR